jgi:hypothetical protein
MTVAGSELLIAALVGALFGLLGYWLTRHIHGLTL